MEEKKTEEEEEVLVLNRKHMAFPRASKLFTLNTLLEDYEQSIVDYGIYMPRSDAEVSTEFKQIIPYLIFYNVESSKFFLVQRKSNASEQRLAGKFSLGIGGHINFSDTLFTESVLAMATREINEEIELKERPVSTKFIGVIDDETNEVGKVHTGFAYLVYIFSDPHIKSELKNGQMIDIYSLIEFSKQNKDSLESWSQIVLDHLILNKESYKDLFCKK